MGKLVRLGQGSDGEITVADHLRDTHMHILGISGQGKSYFIEQIVREDILNGHGVCVIDPHGELFENLSRWIVTKNIDTYRKVHLLDPSNPDWSFGWNPLAVEDGRSLSAKVETLVDAFEKVWGGGSFAQTPRLRKCLSAVLYALGHNKLSLAEARFFTRLQFRDVAKRLTANIDNEEYAALWKEFLYDMPDKMFLEYFDSTVSRLMVFLADDTIRTIVGQTDNVIDFKQAMDRGEIVLINLNKGSALTDESARLLGALICSDLYNAAFARDLKTAKERPFHLTIDECADFLTGSIVNSLDQTRKFGLHICLSHQRLAQLKKYGDDFFNAVMANAQLKVMFKAGDDDTAEVMAKHLFRREFNLEIPKEILSKPTVVDYDIYTLQSKSESRSGVTGSGKAEGSSSGMNAAISQLFNPDGDEIGGYTEFNSEASGNSQSSSNFSATGQSASMGESETLIPVLEVLPTATYSLDELVHLGMVTLLSLPKRMAYIASPELPARCFSTQTIRPALILDKGFRRALNAVRGQSEFSIPRQDAQDAILTRAQSILGKDAEPALVDPEDDGWG
ncbi:MAG: type IV secretion system DNA-binding domain-containing protein [Pseudomonadota bacterium]